MSEQHSGPGTIGWVDLTVSGAPGVRDFYAAVCGWEPRGCDMGGYEDYSMHPAGSGSPVAGVCERRGMNAQVPPGWVIYIRVADLDVAMERVRAGGGAIIGEVRGEKGKGRAVYFRDPSGAAAALWEDGK